MALRHKVYIGLKIAKSNVPVVRRARLLKTTPRVQQYGDRPILSETVGNAALLERVSAGMGMAAGKIGDCELETLLKYESAGHDPERFFTSISKEGHELDLLYVNCGVFPPAAGTVSAWAESYLGALGSIDYLGVWHNTGEREI